MPTVQFAHFKLVLIFGLPIVWGISLLLFLNSTSPLEGGPVSVLSVFVLIYLLLVGLLYACLFSIIKVLSSFGFRFGLAPRTVYYLVSVVALGPVFLLALNTLGQIEPKDVILVVMLIFLGCFYVVRRSPKAHSQS